MTDKKNPETENEEPETALTEEEDKNIDALLKEYADEVKDRDLDDFLKTPDDDHDDAFESDGDDEEDEDDDDEIVTAEPVKKSGGGFLAVLTVLVVFGAAGAGAWWFMNNKDGGMTPMMGGLGGSSMPVANDEASLGMPPSPDNAPVLPPLSGDATDMPPMPTPMAPEDTATADTMEAPADGAMTESTDMPPALDQYAVGDFLAVPVPDDAPVADLPPLPEDEPAPAEAKKAAADAVDAWATGDATGDDMAGDDMPVQEVKEVKAKPVSTPKSEPAPKKAARDPMDDALPPPYVAIQSKSSGTSSASKKGMAPVVDEGYAPRGSTASTEPDVTRATGVYRDLVAKGGGKLDVPGLNVVPAPVGMIENPVQAAPVRTDRKLAINGGKSVPPGTEYVVTKTSVSAPAEAAMPDEPRVIAAPVETVEQVAPDAPMVESAIVTRNVPSSMPADEETDARVILQAAVAAEKSGRAGDALELYQRALEVDAVYGDGRSIDRGAVYDRIGAIRSGR